MNPLDQRNICFVSPHSLLDRSSGAALSMRTLLIALAKKGWRAGALQGTIFDAPIGGAPLLRQISTRKENFLRLRERGVDHFIFRTRDTRRLLMTALEQEQFVGHFQNGLNQLRPDVVLTYGGYLLDRALILAARERGVPVAFYLANGNYHDPSCFKNVDLIITDSDATALLYKQRFGLTAHPVGKFIDASEFKAAVRTPKYITFINPSFDKGVNLFASLVKAAAREIPEAEFLVVQSREDWNTLLQVLAIDPAELSNVRVAPLQHDMRRVYGQTRVLLVPSLWHESGARVITEGMLNGIPALASDSGGISQMLRGTGFMFDVPASVRENKRSQVSAEAAAPWLEIIKRLVRDEPFYLDQCARVHAAIERYSLDQTVSRFLQVLDPLLSRSSGQQRGGAAVSAGA
jgi:glycosyltransferase involved in cell wall biosynthesis